MSINPSTAAVRITAGVDWAKDDHVICAVGDQGQVLDRFAVRHDAAGLRQMAARLLRAGVSQAGIERGDGPVVDTLPEAGLTVFVIPPGQVKNLRSRYGPAGNKDDRFDACVLADTVRTDARRLRPMERDSDQTTALRAAVRARRDLAGHRVAAASQLRAHLQAVFPGAAALFADIDSDITLTFLSRFTTREQADWLSPDRLAAWLKAVSYRGRTDPAVLHARLLAAPRGQAGQHARALAGVTLALVAVLRALNTQIQALADSIGAQLDAHPRRGGLPVPAPLRHRPRRPAAGRDRRRTRPVPDPRVPDLPGRGRPLHPAVRQGQSGHVPVGSIPQWSAMACHAATRSWGLRTHIASGSVHGDARRRASPQTHLVGARRVPPRQCSLRYVINLGVRIGAQFRRYARQLHSLRLPVERCRLAELRAAAFGKVNTLTA